MQVIVLFVHASSLSVLMVLVLDTGNHCLHFLVIADLERVVLESVKVGQFQIDDLLVLGRAGSLGRSRGCFRLDGSVCLRGGL